MKPFKISKIMDNYYRVTTDSVGVCLNMAKGRGFYWGPMGNAEIQHGFDTKFVELNLSEFILEDQRKTSGNVYLWLEKNGVLYPLFVHSQRLL